MLQISILLKRHEHTLESTMHHHINVVWCQVFEFLLVLSCAVIFTAICWCPQRFDVKKKSVAMLSEIKFHIWWRTLVKWKLVQSCKLINGKIFAHAQGKNTIDAQNRISFVHAPRDYKKKTNEDNIQGSRNGTMGTECYEFDKICHISSSKHVYMTWHCITAHRIVSVTEMTTIEKQRHTER